MLLVVMLILFCVTGCSSGKIAPVAENEIIKPAVSEPMPDDAEDTGFKTENYFEDEEISEFLKKKEFISKLIQEMTLQEKVGQMFICSYEENESGVPVTGLDEISAGLLKDLCLGGIIYFAANIDDERQTATLSADFQKNSKIPLFIAVDEEGGRVSRLTKSGKINFSKTPPANQIESAEDAFAAALAIGDKLLDLGINVNLAPCADLSDDTAGVIGDRAFGADPNTVSELVIKSIDGYNQNGIICAVKHFPGHGAASGDTHEEKILSEKKLEEIISEDMIPFVESSMYGVPMIMMSHITVPEWNMPASLSKDAVDYIRQEIGYEGILITDSMRMGAITNYYSPEEAAVTSINAGVNCLLMPKDARLAINGVIKAVKEGDIDIEKIDVSVHKILSLKYDYGLLTTKN